MSSEFVPKPVAVKDPEKETMAGKWKRASGRWAMDVKSGYLSNPAARRDFKVQFRGKGSITVFAAMILIFGGVSLYMFWDATSKGLPPSAIQEQLAIFCYVILAILGVSVTLVAPALASVSILLEKQRRSLDLVFSSPVKPVHYLFGKLIAGYRYVWILMALSLPFTAMSVIMGGGTWLNILECYFLLSLQGLLFTSIGIYFSALVEKTLSALLYTYVTVIGLCVGCATLAMAAHSTGDSMNPFQGGPQSLLLSFVPVLVQIAVGSTTQIFGVAVPNTLLALFVTGGAVNYILRAAGGLLSPLQDKQRRNLRIQSAVIVAGVSGAIGIYAPPFTEQVANNGGFFPAMNVALFLLGSVPLLLFLPFLGCYAPDAERRQNYAPAFRFRDVFGNSVAGALPYLYSVLGLSTVAHLIGGHLAGKTIGLDMVGGICYLFAFWTFVWSTARFASSFLNGIRASRTLQFLTLAAVVGAPLPIFVALTSGNVEQSFLLRVWQFYPFSPFLYGTSVMVTLLHAFLLTVAALGLSRWSEGNFIRRTEKRKLDRLAENEVHAPNFADLVKDEALVQRLVQGS